MPRASLLITAVLALSTAALPASAQQGDPSLLTIRRIYASGEFAAEPFGPARWLEDGTAYTTLEPSADGTGADLVRYDVEKGTREVMVAARQLVPPGENEPLEVEDYGWSPDGTMLLIFTNTRPVWRLNTRGDYWVFDRGTGKLRKLGGPDAKPSTLMFAKFDPAGRRVAYVRENNLYVEDLAGGTITPLTTDGSRTLINGTFDWVYEEELMNYYADGWRWSPDGRSIAYWQLNADSVKNFDLINNTDSLYSKVVAVQYPKVGETNSAARVGIVSASGGPTRWIELEGDPRNHYIPRMEWAANSDEVVLQRLNRLQNEDQVILGDARTGQARTVFTERDSTWVEVVDDFVWLEGGKSFTWVSERDGWKHVYVVSRDGRTSRLVTKGDYDVLQVKGIDPKGGWLYYIASPDNPVQRYLFRVRLDGKGKPERLSPAREPGSHTYDMAPNYKYAIETYSSLGNPPITRLVRLPDHQPVRTLVDNQELRARVTALKRPTVEWLTIPAEDGAKLPGVLLKPADFDSTPEVPAALLRLRRPRGHRGRGRLGRVLPLAQHADPEGLPGRDRGQPGNAGTAGRKFGRRSTASSACSRPATRPSAARTLRERPLRRSGPDRHLGLELRRVHESQRAVPASGALPDGGGRLAGDPLAAVRQRVHRALQRTHHREQGRVRSRLAAQLRGRHAGQPAAGPRRGRRQRALTRTARC